MSSMGFTDKSLCLDNKLQILDSLGTPYREREEEGGEKWKSEREKERMCKGLRGAEKLLVRKSPAAP